MYNSLLQLLIYNLFLGYEMDTLHTNTYQYRRVHLNLLSYLWYQLVMDVNHLFHTDKNWECLQYYSHADAAMRGIFVIV